MAEVGRNDPCPCGSGKKYKKCCLDRGGGPQGTGRDVLVLVGAGASFGHLPPGRAPVPPCGDIRPDLQSLYTVISSWTGYAATTSHLEEWADSLSPEEHTQFLCALTGFFSRFVDVPPDSAYRRAAEALNRRAVFVSLNYDVLLELALLESGCDVDYVFRPGGLFRRNRSAGRHPASVAPVLKPHGSCNWVQTNPMMRIGTGDTFPCRLLSATDDSSGRPTSCWIALSADSTFQGGSVQAAYPLQVPRRGERRGACCMPSLVATYNTSKSVPFNPQVVAAVRRTYADLAAHRFDTVGVIGVRYWPADTHVLDPLRRIATGARRFVYLDPSPRDGDSAQGFEALAGSKFVHLPCGFHDGVEELLHLLVRQ